MKISKYSQASSLWLDYQKALTGYIRSRVKDKDASDEIMQEVPAWEPWDSSHVAACRIVAEVGGRVAGWAALTPVSGRCVYAGVAEVSVYVSDRYRGRKIGAQLLAKLIDESEREGFWTLQAGIFPENKASVKLHENLGFRVVGYRERIGKMNGIWRDNLLLERRSLIVGTD